MRRRLVPVLFAIATLAILLLPASAAASGSGFSYSIVTDRCGRPFGFTSIFKVSEQADGTTDANRLTMDSWVQETTVSRHPHWFTAHTWSQVSTTFGVDGTSHLLTLRRSYPDGNIESEGRIVFRLRAWHNSTVLADVTVKSTPC
jgi:hypothetical protein